jgi:hypothetical protein
MKVIGVKGTSSIRECENCDSLLQFEDDEIDWEVGRNDKGDIDPRFCDNGYIVCPKCNERQWTRRR